MDSNTSKHQYGENHIYIATRKNNALSATPRKTLKEHGEKYHEEKTKTNYTGTLRKQHMQ